VQRVHAHASLIGGIPNRKFAGRKLVHVHSVKPGAHSRSRGVTESKMCSQASSIPVMIPRFADEPFAGRGIRWWFKQPENTRVKPE
jgi:hypothetical protein